MILKFFQLENFKIPVFVINLKAITIINIPTQIGCMIGCTFYPSSTQKVIRNIRYDEFLQLIEFSKSLAKSKNMLLSFTGEGEVYLNHENVNNVIENYQYDADIKSFRLCTSGIKTNKFDKIKSRIKPIAMQLSIHSLFDEKRREIIPKTKNVKDIFNNIKNNESIFNEISINYVMIQGFNDSENDLQKIKK
jgi:23S rRNA (adenine2503-C2)-methyltransferase